MKQLFTHNILKLTYDVKSAWLRRVILVPTAFVVLLLALVVTMIIAPFIIPYKFYVKELRDRTLTTGDWFAAWFIVIPLAIFGSPFIIIFIIVSLYVEILREHW